LSRVFRSKFVAGLKRLFRRNRLRFFGACQTLSGQKAFAAFLRTLFREEWVVYAKPPFGGPQHVLQYLARYTHRVAISNHRLLDVTNHEVTFRWKDYAQGSKQRAMTLTHEEFLRRFLQHVLPTGFPRIRYFGFLAHRRRRLLLPLCRHLLAAVPLPALAGDPVTADHRCPRCQAVMRVVERLTPQQLSQQTDDRMATLDSS
jgi:Putative transposase